MQAIRSKKDAKEFVFRLSKNPENPFIFRDSEVLKNVGRNVAYTRITALGHDLFSVYSYWTGGSDISPTHKTFQELAEYVWKHRKDINAGPICNI